MPKKMHEALKKSAKKKGLTGSRRDRYVYGTMAKHKARKKKG
jgi:ribosomal protein S21